MGLIEIAASFTAATVVGLLTRGVWRTYFLLALSVLAVYWLQPAIPLRFFDFWFPSLTLALVILTWLITAKADAWRDYQNRIALLVMVGIATLVDLSRYFLPKPILTATTPPQFIQYLIFILILAIIILSFFWLSRRQSWILSFTILVLIA